MTARQNRMVLVVLLIAGLGAGLAAALTSFEENMQLFFSPTEIEQGKAPENRAFRLGGMVKDDSFIRSEDSLKVSFIITDHATDTAVEYEGILPDLFREGQGIVALGRLQNDGTFVADEVLAKHDETYMPPAVADALEKGKLKAQNEAAQ